MVNGLSDATFDFRMRYVEIVPLELVRPHFGDLISSKLPRLTEPDFFKASRTFSTSLSRTMTWRPFGFCQQVFERVAINARLRSEVLQYVL